MRIISDQYEEIVPMPKTEQLHLFYFLRLFCFIFLLISIFKDAMHI